MDKNTLNEVDKIKKESLSLIGEARTEEAFILLKKFLEEKDSKLLSELTRISNRFHDARRKELSGLGSKNKKVNRIIKSLTELIERIGSEPPEVEDLKIIKINFIYLTGFIVSVMALAIVYILVNRENKIPKQTQNKIHNKSVIEGINFKIETHSHPIVVLGNPMKRNKITLKYKSERLKGIYQDEFYLYEKLSSVKNYFLRKYKIENTYMPQMIDKNQWTEWIIMRDEKTIYTSEDELLSLETLVLQNKIREYDELMIAKSSIELTQSNQIQFKFTVPKNSDSLIREENISLLFDQTDIQYNFHTTHLVWLAFCRTDELHFTYVGHELEHSNFLTPNFPLFVFHSSSKYSIQPLSEPSKPINQEKPKKKNSNHYLLNKYGLKPEDEIYILGEEHDE